uniref:Zinc finger CCCH domain-containing protein 44 n=1 Tax=Oryza brachyantha TaxID=4533 RepID=J3LJ69_ORYBR
MDDSQFLGSIIGEPAQAHQAPAEAGATVGVKRRRGRPPKKRDGAAAAAGPGEPARKRVDEEEVVCFICFDGGNLVVCDRRGCPKVYHPACIKRDEAFFQSRSKWNCGWHICSSCEKAVHYMCYTCTYSLCKIVVDFDDQNSWEYLFKLYWLDLKGKLSLTLEELTSAKSRWNAPTTYTRKEKDESSDDLYDANNDDDAGSDCSSGKRKWNSSRKKGQKRQKTNSDCSIATKKFESVTRDSETLPSKVPIQEASLPVDTKWASPELLEFVGHMRNGDLSFISQFDVQALLLDYIKQNNLRDPQRKSQIICDSRLHRLFRKTRVAHFEMLKLLEMHFLVSEPSAVNDDSQGITNPSSAQIDHASGYSDMAAKFSPDRRRRMHRKMERESQANPEDYAAIDMHNISLIYLRRSLMEDLIDDPTFSDKISGAFVRIRISGLGQKQDMYRLVKVVGTQKVPEKYSIGKKTTNLALEILNLNKKEIITMDTVSNQDFTEEECKRLRQSMKYDLISRLKVGDIQAKANIFQLVRVNDLLNTPEERARKINEVLDVHVDSHMDPDYESAEEFGSKKTAEWNVNWARSDPFGSPVKVKYPNTVQKNCDATRHLKNQSKQNTVRKPVVARNSENPRSSVGMDIPKSVTNAKSTMCGTTPLPYSGVTVSGDIEPEKVWHYKDPSGNVQGPFTLLQLSKWTSYFPRDMRVWLTFESEERSLLLTEVLSKQPKDFGQPAALTTSSKSTLADTGQNRSTQLVDLNKAPSPVGYSMLNSSETTIQCTKHSGPERESVNSLDDRLSLTMDSVPLKDTKDSNSQPIYQIKHSSFPPSSGSPRRQSDLHHDEVQGGRSGEWNNQHNSGEMWSPAMPQTSSSAHSNVESHHNHYALCSQAKSFAPATPVEDRGSSSPSGMLSHSERAPICSPQSAPSVSASDTCKMEETMNQQKPLEADISNASVNQSPNSKILPESSPDNQDIEREYPSPPPMSECKELSPQSRTNRESSPDNQEVERQYPSPQPISESKEVPPQLKIIPESSDNHDIEREHPSPPPIPESKEQSPQSKILPESSPDNQDIEHEHPNPPPIPESKELSPQCKILPESSPDNQGIKCEYPSPTPIPESKGLSLQSKVPGPSHDDQDVGHEYPCPTPICESKEVSRQSKIPSGSSLDNQDIEHGYHSPNLISESKELTINLSQSISLAPEKIASGEDSSLPFIFPKSPRAGDGALKSVSDIETTHIEGGDSNVKELYVKEELYVESTVIREDMVVNPASGVESVDMSENLLESLMEQSCGTFYLDGAAALEGFLSKEEPQCSSPIALSTCSSPIALSPWGESGYYQGDSVGSSLWGVQDDDPICEMWQLSTQTPAVQYSSGTTAHFIDEVTVTQVNNEIIPRNTTPGEKVELPNSGACTVWGLVEQMNPEANDTSVSMIDRSTGLVCSQPSANGGPNVDTSRNTNHNTNLSLSHETAVPLSKGSGEASRKPGCATDLNVATSGEALGNTKNWNPSAGNANRGSQRSHHRDRYSQISESWLLSSNYSRSRSDGFGSGGSSRSTPRGQTQRGICKFHESGYCRKGASCNYLHP